MYVPCHSVRNGAQDALHHGQMLSVVVRLEERDAQVQFEHNTSVDQWFLVTQMTCFKKALNRTHPMDQTSHGCAQPSSRITSGAR